mgnify:CR=1 FL=1
MVRFSQPVSREDLSSLVFGSNHFDPENCNRNVVKYYEDQLLQAFDATPEGLNDITQNVAHYTIQLLGGYSEVLNFWAPHTVLVKFHMKTLKHETLEVSITNVYRSTKNSISNEEEIKVIQWLEGTDNRNGQEHRIYFPLGGTMHRTY